MTVDAGLLTMVVSMVVLAGVLVWSSAFHRGWKMARQAELRRVRERQRRIGQDTAGRPRRSQRL